VFLQPNKESYFSEDETSRLSTRTLSRLEFLKLLTFILIFSFVWAIVFRIPSKFASATNQDTQTRYLYTDKFGVKKIYPTKKMGREWFINMDDPMADGVFDPQTELTRNADGTWRVGSADKDEGYNGRYHIVMNIDTPVGQIEWKDVEITGYFKAIDVDESDDEEDNSSRLPVLQWYARGNNHNSELPCEGTSLKCRIYSDGHVGWVKEIWHDGGYTQERGNSRPTGSIKGRWIGWKAVIYNIEGGKAVKMEGYLDDASNNNWNKVTEVTDNGDWYSEEERFEEAECNRPKNYVITNSGAKAAFRSDGVRWDFKSLSVREIRSV
jgi:hypothetical protein